MKSIPKQVRCPYCKNKLNLEMLLKEEKAKSVKNYLVNQHLSSFPASLKGEKPKSVEKQQPNFDFHSIIPTEFTMKFVGEVKGFRSKYEFAKTEFAILSFCNNVLNIPTGVIPFETIKRIENQFHNKRVKHPTKNTDLALHFFPEYKGTRIGYALQNVFLYLVAVGRAKMKKVGHGLEFHVRAVEPINQGKKSQKENYRLVSSVQGYRNNNRIRVYEGKGHFLTFSRDKLDLKTGRIEKASLSRLSRNYLGSRISRVSTLKDIALRYFPDVDADKAGFKLLHAFYTLVGLGLAKQEKVSRTLRFTVEDIYREDWDSP